MTHSFPASEVAGEPRMHDRPRRSPGCWGAAHRIRPPGRHVMTASILLAPPSPLARDEPTSLITGPLAYGYMRVPADAPDHRVRRVEQAVARFAAAKGLYFVG